MKLVTIRSPLSHHQAPLSHPSDEHVHISFKNNVKYHVCCTCRKPIRDSCYQITDQSFSHFTVPWALCVRLGFQENLGQKVCKFWCSYMGIECIITPTSPENSSLGALMQTFVFSLSSIHNNKPLGGSLLMVALLLGNYMEKKKFCEWHTPQYHFS